MSVLEYWWMKGAYSVSTRVLVDGAGILYEH